MAAISPQESRHGGTLDAALVVMYVRALPR
jgi:hypothetical protein